MSAALKRFFLNNFTRNFFKGSEWENQEHLQGTTTHCEWPNDHIQGNFHWWRLVDFRSKAAYWLIIWRKLADSPYFENDEATDMYECEYFFKVLEREEDDFTSPVNCKALMHFALHNFPNPSSRNEDKSAGCKEILWNASRKSPLNSWTEFVSD